MSDSKKTLKLNPALAKKASSGVEVVRIGKRRQTSSGIDEHAVEQTTALSDKERMARLRALENVPQQTNEDRKKLELLRAEEERRKKLQVEQELQKLEQEKEQRRQEEEQRKESERDARKKAEAIAEREEVKAQQRQEDGVIVDVGGVSHIPSGGSGAFTESDDARKAEKGKKRRSPSGKPRNQNRRGGAGRLNLNEIMTGGGGDKDGGERTRSLASLKRMRAKEKQKLEDANAVREKIIRDVIIPDTITVGELANRMAERTADVIKELMKSDIIAAQNQFIDGDTAELIAHEFGHRTKRVSQSDVEDTLIKQEDTQDSDVRERPPVVTVMGHVDHGKTSLLDSLRKTSVAGGEAGGITQHIGAYQIVTNDGHRITFIDTPGHAAFTQMRARGTKVTDIVILVVAADDSVQPQTIEAINHAKAADVPVIIAVNKCDKEEADVQKIYTQLIQHGLQAETMGGNVQAVEISAKTGANLDKLLEAILLQSELLELKGGYGNLGRGVIIEAKLEKGRGAMATVLVQSGCIKVGDIFIAGKEWGKIRALLDENGEQVREANISKPVEILGLNATPDAGDDFIIVSSESKAREVSEYRTDKAKESKNLANKRGSLEQMLTQFGSGEVKGLNVVIKADVQGSLEAIRVALEQMATDEVKVNILHGAVGGITESDINLAQSGHGFVIGFNVRPNAQARALAKRDTVDIQFYSIIYNLLDDIKGILGGLLSPDKSEEILGLAEVRDIFNISKVGKIAGCMVIEGNMKRNCLGRIVRDDTVIFDGKFKQMKRFKDDVAEVKEGYECGISLENFDSIVVGDKIECYQVKETARSL